MACLVPGIHTSVINLPTGMVYALKELILAYKSQPAESIKVAPKLRCNAKEKVSVMMPRCLTPNILVS